jgi:hypothetical protein
MVWGVLAAVAVACDSGERVAVTDTRPEPPGEHCAGGGTAIVAGVDEDGSGTLEGGEIAETFYLCDRSDVPPTDIVGDVVLTNEVEAARYVGSRTISGNLIIRGTGPIVLPALVSVGGSVRCERLAGGAFELPALEDVGGSVSVMSECPVPGVPRVRTIGANLSIPQVSPAAVAFELTQLRSVHDVTLGGFTEVRLPALETARQVMIDATSIELPVLRTATYVRLESMVTSFSAPMLTDVETFWATGSASMTSVVLPSLARANNVELDNMAALTSVSMPALTSIMFNLRVASNGVLTSINFPALTSLMFLTVTDNPMLPRCMAQAIETRTGAISTISGNGNGMCP